MKSRLILGAITALILSNCQAKAAPCTLTNEGRQICSGPVDNQPKAERRSARGRHHRQVATTVDANGSPASNLRPGVVVSHKTGAMTRVGAQYAAKFQGYIDELEANGATIRSMGGIRSGHCWPGGLHPCGKALDICQLSRGRVDARCRLPGPNQLATIAERHGLFEGGQWCSSDYGHAQVGVTAGACGTIASARSRHHHHKIRVAGLKRKGGHIMLPPKRFDHPYIGKTDIRVSAPEFAAWQCDRLGVSAPGCSYLDHKVCVIIMPANIGDDRNDFIRHERAHCSGWGRDHSK